MTWSQVCTEDTLLEWPVNLTVVWRFVFGACVLTKMLVCKENNCIFVVNIRRHFTKFCRPGDQVPGICTPWTGLWVAQSSNRSSIPRNDKTIFRSSKVSRPDLENTQHPIQWCWRLSGRDLNLLLRLRMSGAIPPFPNITSRRVQGPYLSPLQEAATSRKYQGSRKNEGRSNFCPDYRHANHNYVAPYSAQIVVL